MLSSRSCVMDKKVEYFAKNCFQNNYLPIVAHDERFTTAHSHKVLKTVGVNRKRREIHDNTFVAVLILQNFFRLNATNTLL